MGEEQKGSAQALEPSAISNSHLHDGATEKDSLDFEPYVRAVTSFIISEKTRGPLTISVEGGWGSGKSSFMKQLQKRLKEDDPGGDKYFFAWFNAWRHDKDEELWAAFALSFIRQLSKQLSEVSPEKCMQAYLHLLSRRLFPEEGDPEKFNIAWKLGCYIALFVFTVGVAALEIKFIRGDIAKHLTAALLLTSAGPTIIFIYSIYKRAVKIGLFLSVPLDFDFNARINGPDYQGKIAFLERFHEDFERVVKAFAGNRKVIVFIDDLDRCETPKAADLMQALNLIIADIPNLRFVIGMDREKVAAGFAVKHESIIKYLYPSAEEDEEKNGESGVDYGHEFIEKFIQVPFRLPNPTEAHIRKMLKTGIAPAQGQAWEESIRPFSILGELKWYSRSAWYIFLQFIPTFRSIYHHVTRFFYSQLPTFRALYDACFMAPVDWMKIDLKRVIQAASGIHAPPPPPQPNEPGMVQPTTEESKAYVVLGEVDSDTIHDIVVKVAPAFTNNPRRIKQFLNLFRLRAYVAAETGILGPKKDQTFTPITLQNLGKFTAIALCWPRLIDKLQVDKNLLNDFEEWASRKPADYTSPQWFKYPGLSSFLESANKANGINDPAYSLKNIDLNKLLTAVPFISEITYEEKKPPEAEKTKSSVSGTLDIKITPPAFKSTGAYDNSQQPEEGIKISGSQGPYAGKKLSKEEISSVLELHKLYLESDGREGQEANLFGADLSGSGLFGANLKNANLSGADLSNANLKDAKLDFTDLTGAQLGGADLTGAKLGGADLKSVRYSINTKFPEDVYPQSHGMIYVQPEDTDPNKGIFGGKPVANGRRLSAKIFPEPDNPAWCFVNLTVEPTNGDPNIGDVTFYLHAPTFPEPTKKVTPDANGKAVYGFTSYGAFTVGVEVDGGSTRLELDLADVPGGTESFYKN